MIAAPRRGRSTSRLRIVVLGHLVRGPLGGMAWHPIQYALGLHELGHDVIFIEDSDDYESCYDPERGRVGTDPSYGLRFATEAMAMVGLGDRWAYHDAHRGVWHGPLADSAVARCTSADVVVNISGVNPLRPWLMEAPTRVFVDTDPGFTQIRHLTDPARRALADAHTAFFSFGVNIGRPGCLIPDDGYPWRPTRQPVVLRAWPVRPASPADPFTTVMQWDSYPERVLGGLVLGTKAVSFPPYADLPVAVPVPLELAATGRALPRDLLASRGWRIVDSAVVTRDPSAYRRYIQHSRGEFTVAKQGYVDTRSGWFSERSAAYLASGRPVVTQDTAFEGHVPVGRGLLAYRDAQQAAEAIRQVVAEYDRHAEGAREVATVFDSVSVLGRLLEQSLSTAPDRPPTAVAG